MFDSPIFFFSSKMPNYKLTYFPVKALAEPIRFIFAYAGVDYVDDRFDRENWPTLKTRKFSLFSRP